MKRTPIVSMVALMLLSVMLLSCGMQRSLMNDDYYEMGSGPNRVVLNNGWIGPNTIVVERDPFTGRYYQINPGGFYNPWGFSNPWLMNPGPRVAVPRGGGAYNGPRVQGPGRPIQPAQPRPQTQRPTNEDARNQILGPRRY